jgi:lipopolysaccharide export system protein LptA
MSFFLLAVEPPALINTVAEPQAEERQERAEDERQVSEEDDLTTGIPLAVTPAPLEPKNQSEESVSIPLTVTPPPETVEVKPLVPDEGIPLKPLPSSEGNAAALGKPLSVQNSPTPTPVNVTIHPETEIVSGLNQKALNQKNGATRLLVRKKGEKTSREYLISLNNSLAQAVNPEGETPLELIADEQEFDQNSQIITARGNVTLRFSRSVLTADRLQINLPEKLAVAEGQVILTRGDQILRGDRFEYYFVQDSGVVFNANGEIFQPSTARDLGQTLPTDVGAGASSSFGTLTDRLTLNQPLQRITTGEGFQFVVGGQDPSRRDRQNINSPSGGTINRIRFQAERLNFDGKVWNATNVRLTNDPFSPPELEVRANSATFRSTGPFTDELRMSNSQLVFDQRVVAPTFINSLTFDRRRRRPFLLAPGYDGEDRGGFFVESPLTLVETPKTFFELTPQYLIQKVLNPDAFPSANPGGGEVSPLSPKAFGLLGDFATNFGERSFFQATASFSNLDLEQIENSVRSKIRFQQTIGQLQDPYLLNVEYNYRERLFNGSLGFQTVNSSIGAILTSPVILIPNTDIRLSYQASLQNINAPTDRSNLLPANATDNVTNLSRFQAAVSLNRSFLLWSAKTLPPTPEEGLRFSPVPVQPYISFFTGVTGVTSYYTNAETQSSVTGTVGLLGQFGRFSRSFFDYTGFNISFSQGLVNGQSPFFFDRFVDQQTVSYGITQQVYGPIRVGFQSVYSIDQAKEISTEYFLEWSRRTYSLILRYNPILQLGILNIRVSDFNWTGNPGYFEGSDVRPVVDGVTR